MTASFEEQLKQEDIFQMKAAQTEDYKEGVKAFMEKENRISKVNDLRRSTDSVESINNE